VESDGKRREPAGSVSALAAIGSGEPRTGGVSPQADVRGTPRRATQGSAFWQGGVNAWAGSAFRSSTASSPMSRSAPNR